MPAFGHSVGGQRYNASCPTPSTLAGLIFGRHASLCTRYGARSSLQSAAPKHEFHQPIQRDLGRPDAAAKINRFSFPPNQLHLRASRLIEEGRTRRHDTWSAGSGGREAPARARHCRAVSGFVLETVSNRSAQDERRYCVRQKRVVLAPVAGVKSAEVSRGPTGFARPSIRR